MRFWSPLFFWGGDVGVGLKFHIKLTVLKLLYTIIAAFEVNTYDIATRKVQYFTLRVAKSY